jgi:FkbM family methyltransferase
MNGPHRLESLWSKRFWRKIGVKLLPESIKHPIRLRLHGLTGKASTGLLKFGSDENGSFALIDDSIKLRSADSLKPSLNYQLVDNVDCIEEATGFLKLARSKSCMFDAGAYVGLFSLLFCASGRDKKAVAFEPSSAMLPILQSHIELNNLQDRIKVRPVAIGSSDGDVSFSVEDSGFVQVISSPMSTGKTMVPMSTIDSECKLLGMKPDLLKIDVEGFEFEALKGAEQLLKSDKPDILLELHLNYLEDLGISSIELCQYLEKFGYRFFFCNHKPCTLKDICDSLKPVVRFFATVSA